MSETIWWEHDHPALLDQTRLPFEEVILHCRSVDQMAEAIRSLRVRGAPAIGVAAAYGVALAARLAAEAVAYGVALDATLAAGSTDAERGAFVREHALAACATLAATRPTAVNLFWAIERMRTVIAVTEGDDPRQVSDRLLAEAYAIAAEDAAACRRMGEIGAALIEDGMGLLTHCNAGALATAGIGTATAPIFVAHEQGRRLHVWVDETRPLLQGARLTAWELRRAGVPFTLITDNMAAHIMRLGRIQAVFVGADRVAANGDIANKIGTYSVALAARAHDIPFYVMAPTSTVDLATPDGGRIPIEERRPEEVRAARGHPLVPDDFPVYNPAFDVTPAAYVTAIITERGIARPPFTASLAAIMAGRDTLTTETFELMRS